MVIMTSFYTNSCIFILYIGVHAAAPACRPWQRAKLMHGQSSALECWLAWLFDNRQWGMLETGFHKILRMVRSVLYIIQHKIISQIEMRGIPIHQDLTGDSKCKVTFYRTQRMSGLLCIFCYKHFRKNDERCNVQNSAAQASRLICPRICILAIQHINFAI